MRSNVIKITDYHKLVTCKPINSTAGIVISQRGAYIPPPEPKLQISPGDAALFIKLFSRQRRRL